MVQYAGCCRDLRGNVDNDENDELDISDVVYLTNSIFNSPPSPQPICPEESDIDGSGEMDITDLVTLVNYFFFNGSGPQSCH